MLDIYPVDPNLCDVPQSNKSGSRAVRVVYLPTLSPIPRSSLFPQSSARPSVHSFVHQSVVRLSQSLSFFLSLFPALSLAARVFRSAAGGEEKHPLIFAVTRMMNEQNRATSDYT